MLDCMSHNSYMYKTTLKKCLTAITAWVQFQLEKLDDVIKGVYNM